MSDQAATIVVEQVGPYGIKANGVWFGLTDRSGITPKQFIVGQTYQVTIYYSKAGKGYISGVTAGQLNAPVAAAPAVTSAPNPATGGTVVSNVSPPPPPPPPPAAPKPPFRGTGFQRPVRGGESQDDYERRQKQIIRQSSLSSAVAFYKDKNVDAATLLALAEAFEGWVNR